MTSYIGEIAASAIPNPPGASYLRVVFLNTVPENQADLNAVFTTGWQPAIASAPGLHAGCAGNVDGGATALVCTLWDTQEQAESGVQPRLPDAQQQLEAVGAFLKQRLIYPVVAEVGGTPSAAR
jgi:hypothetical protein